MAKNEWKQKLFHILQRWFCNPSDDIESKRKQCVLAGANLLLIVLGLVSKIHGFVMGTFTNGALSYISISLYIASAVHIRMAKTRESARVLFAATLFSNFLHLYERGGFLYQPHIPFLGLMVPILSIFVCDRPKEPVFWGSLFWSLNILVFVLERSHHLPPTPLPSNLMSFANFLTSLYLAFFMVSLFAFVFFVYTTEVEARQSLEKDLGLFMRLSHEIRTPATIIVSTAELMQEWGETLSPEKRKSLADLTIACRRLTSVVSDILTFSAMEADSPGRQPQKKSIPYHEADDTARVHFNLREVVDAVVRTNLDSVEQAGLSLYLDIPAEASVDVKGEKGRLECVVDHLVSNAIKFTPAGWIRIKVRLTDDVIVGTDIVNFEFEVTDTGVGISPDELGNLFRPFCPSGHGASYDGLGLGLAVANRLVQRWDQPSIQVTSHGPGHGSTFSFIAPFRTKSSPRSPNSASSRSMHQFRCQFSSSVMDTDDSDSPGGIRPLEMELRASFNVLVVDEDHMSARNVIQTCNLLGVSAHRATFEEAVPAFCRSFDVVIWALSSMSSFNQTNQSVIQAALNQTRIQSPDLLSRMAVMASSVFQPWVASVAECHFLRRPVSVADLEALGRAIAAHPPQNFALRSSTKPGLVVFSPLPQPVNLACMSIEGSSHSLFPAVSLAPTSIMMDSSDPTDPMTLPSVVQNPEDTTTTNALRPDDQRGKQSISTSNEESSGKQTTTHTELDAGPCQSPETTVSSGEPEISSSCSARILVIDDNAIIRKLLVSVLSSRPNPLTTSPWTLEIKTAENGEEALALITSKTRESVSIPFELIFSDFNMPLMDGVEFTRRVRALERDTWRASASLTSASGVVAIEPEAPTPIIGITAATNMIPECLAAGMTQVITKPFSKAQIHSLVQQYLFERTWDNVASN